MADTFTTLPPGSGPAEKLLFGLPDWSVVGSEDAAAVATATALAGYHRVADCAVVSLSAAPAAAINFQLTTGATVLFRCEIPAAATGPIVIPLRGLRSTLGASLVGTVTDPGGTTVATISMKGINIRGA